MTGNSNKVRAVLLAALMIFSVFAGTVALSGSAAAANTTGDADYAGGAVQYDNTTNGNWIIEVPLEGGTVSNDTADTSNITLLDDDDDVTSSAVDNVSTRESGGAIVLNLNDKYASNDLEVEFGSAFESNLDGQEISVEFAPTTIEDVGTAGLNGGNQTVYAGETLAFINASSSVEIEGDDDDNSGYFQTFANGTNSSVFYVNTDDLSGDYQYNESDDFLNVRDLGLDVTIDDLNVTTEDDIEGTVSAVDSGRTVTVELLDDNDDVVATDVADLSGQGEYDFDISADRDTGDYTVEVTDNNTQIQVESSTITISEEDDDDASFTESTISDQRGDIVEMTVQMDSTDFASISVGEDDGSEGVRANATVEDEDGDGEVTVYLNTYKLRTGTANDEAFAVDDDSDDSVTDQTVEENTSDLIDAGQYDLEVMAGEETYSDSSDGVATLVLEERSTDTLRMWTGSSEEISPSDLEDVNEAIENGEITQSSEIAVGDYAVHQVVASGFEGALEARENEDVTSQFETAVTSGPLNLTIEEASPGANQDAQELNLSYGDNVTVIADGPNDTYFVIVNTDNVDLQDPDGTNKQALPDDDDTALETNFTVLQDDAGFDFTPDGEFDDDENSETFVEFGANEPEVTIDRPYNVSQASGQTVSGTTNIAPGTELSVRVRSQSGVSPSFLKTADPVVQSDGTFSASFDFSEQNVGDEYDIQVNGQVLDDGPEEESGEVVEAVATDTATPEPTDTETATPEPTDTETATPEPTDTATAEPTDEPTDEPTSTPTSTPGFGVIVALTALLAAALLAVRRDN